MHAGQESPEEGAGPGDAEVLLRGLQRDLRQPGHLRDPHPGQAARQEEGARRGQGRR